MRTDRHTTCKTESSYRSNVSRPLLREKAADVRECLEFERIHAGTAGLVRRKVRDALMAEEIEIDPFRRAAAFGAAEQIAVERAGFGEIVDGKCRMKRLKRTLRGGRRGCRHEATPLRIGFILLFQPPPRAAVLFPPINKARKIGSA